MSAHLLLKVNTVSLTITSAMITSQSASMMGIELNAVWVELFHIERVPGITNTYEKCCVSMLQSLILIKKSGPQHPYGFIIPLLKDHYSKETVHSPATLKLWQEFLA